MNGKMEKMEKMEPKAEKAAMQPMAQPMMKAKAPQPMGYSGTYDSGKMDKGSCYDHGRKSGQ